MVDAADDGKSNFDGVRNCQFLTVDSMNLSRRGMMFSVMDKMKGTARRKRGSVWCNEGTT